MNSARYSWRVVAFAAISLIGNFYLGYYLLFGLAPDGVDLADKNGYVVVSDVGEATPGARGGLQTGDQVVSVNGQRIGTAVDWLAQRMNFVADQPTAIRVQRGEQSIDLSMVIHGRIWDQYRDRKSAV
jgi:S1-C subfamily serine protease